MIHGEPKSRSILRETAFLAFLALLLTGLALAHTAPLLHHLDTAIPSSDRASVQFGGPVLTPGDQLQFFYWSWLMVDNIAGPSKLLTNPYEFNTFLSPGLPNFANFPLSLLYVLFRPLGEVLAYNIVFVLSYVLAGLAAYALARFLTGSRVAGLFAGLAFGLLPTRAGLAIGGHLYGFTAFLLPLALWCLERALARRSAKSAVWWSAGAGGVVLAAGLMEPHLIYYLCLFLAVYLPLRLLLVSAENRAGLEDEPPGLPALFMALAGALGAGVFAHVALEGMRGTPDYHLALMIYPALTLCLWVLLAGIIPGVSAAGPGRARSLAARAFLPLVALPPVYSLAQAAGWEGAGTVLPSLFLLAGLVWTGAGVWPIRKKPALTWGHVLCLWPLALGGLAAVGRMFHTKAQNIDASIAGAGRNLSEIAGRSHTAGELFDLSSQGLMGLWMGRFPVWLALAALLFLVLGRPARLRRAGTAAFFLAAGLALFLLALGCRISSFPLYEFLYGHLPFFNYPRLPKRLAIFAVLALSLAGAWVWSEILRRMPWKKVSALVLGLGVTVLVAFEYWPAGPMGLCLIPPAGPLEKAIVREMPTGPEADRRLVQLPIWPGESHISSYYDLTITRTRALMVNGYTPMVPLTYLDQVFKPLSHLNQGDPSGPALTCLAKLRTGLVVFHEDSALYTRQVGPFPPALARRRLLASGLFATVLREDDAWLLRPRLDGASPRPLGDVTSPVTVLLEGERLFRNTGGLEKDPLASGWEMLHQCPASPGGERLPRPDARGNIAAARAGRDNPGHLAFGPFMDYPAGDYVARFRLRRGTGAGAPGVIDASTDSGRRQLASLELTPDVLPADGLWHEVAMPFRVEEPVRLELRTWFSGKADLFLDAVLVNFAGRIEPEAFYPAADLWRETGRLTGDPAVEGGLAVLALPERDFDRSLMMGPGVTLPPGCYRAGFRLALGGDAPNPAAALAYLETTVSPGYCAFSGALAAREVTEGMLDGQYRDIILEFNLDRQREVSFGVTYTRAAPLKLAGVSLTRLSGPEKDGGQIGGK